MMTTATLEEERLFEEKLGRAEDRWQHAMELHNQRMEALYRQSKEDRAHSEELNRTLIKNIAERTDKLDHNIERLENKFEKLGNKLDDSVKEIKSSNRNTAWVSAALVVTVLAGLIAVLRS